MAVSTSHKQKLNTMCSTYGTYPKCIDRWLECAQLQIDSVKTILTIQVCS